MPMTNKQQQLKQLQQQQPAEMVLTTTTRTRRRRRLLLLLRNTGLVGLLFSLLQSMMLLLLLLLATTTTQQPSLLLGVSSFVVVAPPLPTTSRSSSITIAPQRTLSSSSSSSQTKRRRRTRIRIRMNSNDNEDTDTKEEAIVIMADDDDDDEERPSSSSSDSSINNNNNKAMLLMGTIATAGAIETAYLTYTKLLGVEPNICTDNGSSCGSVLNGPYSSIPIGDGGIHVPIAALGFLAYTTVAILAFTSSNANQSDDVGVDEQKNNTNMAYIKAITTGMGTFSIFLMAILFGVLKETCVLCVTSAVLSTSLMCLSYWMNGYGNENNEDRDKDRGVIASIGTSLTATAAAVVLFMSNSDGLVPSFSQQQQQQQQQDLGAPPPLTTLLASTSSSASSSLLASSAGSTADDNDVGGEKPPAITTKSTKRTIEIANSLQKLDTNFYGAFWCSHCYEQKQELGAQAMSKINYVECSKDGYNSQTKLCRSKKVPGYPTWEINGILYPGEQALEELEDIITSMEKETSTK